MRKTDIVLIAAFVIFAIAFYFIFNINSNSGDTVIIKVNGKIYAEISLNEDKDIEIYRENGTLSNTARIKDKKVFMIYADCPDKLCMNQSIAYNYIIVCLPNRATVEISGNSTHKNKFDIIV